MCWDRFDQVILYASITNVTLKSITLYNWHTVIITIITKCKAYCRWYQHYNNSVHLMEKLHG